jgi:hypothetical protein
MYFQLLIHTKIIVLEISQTQKKVSRSSKFSCLDINSVKKLKKRQKFKITTTKNLNELYFIFIYNFHRFAQIDVPNHVHQ